MNSNTGQYTTDQDLVERVLNGDRNAFGIIVKNTENLVARILFDTIANESDRKDIAQDIYLKVFQKLPGFRFQSKLSTWIAQISYHTCIDHLRKKKNVLLENTAEDSENDLLDSMNMAKGLFSASSESTVTQKDRIEIIRSGINKLPTVYKTLITLYHHEELSYEEITAITGLPGGTVKSYLFRARKELKNGLLLHYKKEDLC